MSRDPNLELQREELLPDKRSRAKRAVLTIAVLLAIGLAYANSFSNGFHFDDFHTIVDNPAIRSLHNIPRFFTDATTFSVLPANRTYRPVISTTLALDYALGRAFGNGYNPFWYHIGTFAFFLLQVVLMAALFRLLLNKVRPAPANDWIGLFAAAWYGLHPAMAETVNYIIQRGDLYCTLGCVAALLVYGRYPRLRRSGLYLLPLVFALLSKPPAAVFPLLLALFVLYFEATSGTAAARVRRSLLAAIPAFLVTALLLWLQFRLTPRTFLPSTLSPWQYRLTQPYVWLRYAGELFLPLHLSVDTDLAPFTGLNLRALAGLLFLVVLAVAIWMCSRRRLLYPIAFGLLWFAITQLPTSLYPLSEVENDHRMFFSFVGLILAVIWAVSLLLARAPLLLDKSLSAAARVRLHALLVGCGVLILSGYAYGVHVRNGIWRDEESLWRDDVAKSSHNGRGLMIYGLTQMDKGDYAAALKDFNRALQYTPNYATLEVNLGVVNGAIADRASDGAAAALHATEAEQHFLRAIALAPEDDIPHAYYGRWLEDHGRFAEAIAHLRTAIALNPQRPLQRNLLIEVYQHNGDLVDAQLAARAALSLAPDDAEAQQALLHPAKQGAAFWINLSLAQYNEGFYTQSIQSALRALQLKPDSAEAYTNIGAGYGAMEQWDEAIRNEREALRLNPALRAASNNLSWYLQQRANHEQKVNQPVSANAAPRTAAGFVNDSLRLYQAGQFADSIAAAREALRLDPHSAEAWNNVAAGEAALHHWDDSIAAAERAIALNPEFQLARNNLAWAKAQKVKSR